MRQIDNGMEGSGQDGTRRWFVDGGHTMVVIDPIGRDPALSTGRSIDRVFAISSTETTLEQFLRFRRDHPYQKAVGTDPQCPANVVSWYDAVAYCSWLDEKSSVPVKERCYPPVDQIKEGMQIPPDYLSRTGHRLPTAAEWEYAARALTTTDRYYGERVGLLAGYAWFSENSGGLLHPVGSLKPNAFGLFDVYGNVLEWCQETIAFCRQPCRRDVEDLTPTTANYERVIRSAAYNFPPPRLVSGYLGPISPVTQWDNIGLPRGTYDQESALTMRVAGRKPGRSKLTRQSTNRAAQRTPPRCDKAHARRSCADQPAEPVADRFALRGRPSRRTVCCKLRASTVCLTGMDSRWYVSTMTHSSFKVGRLAEHVHPADGAVQDAVHKPPRDHPRGSWHGTRSQPNRGPLPILDSSPLQSLAVTADCAMRRGDIDGASDCSRLLRRCPFIALEEPAAGRYHTANPASGVMSTSRRSRSRATPRPHP